ncbi:MAG: hypothetical protein J6W42_03065 [Bacteroidaceae bacterium]|nr:hypothetical protein [Bacteroidaceae bacterium]
MTPKTNRILSNICFFLIIASFVGIAAAARYSYATDPDPIINICIIVGLVSVVLHILLRRHKSE